MKRVFLAAFLCCALSFSLYGVCFAQTAPSSSVELNGDTVEYSIDGNTINASGHVEVIYQGTKLTCDQLQFSQNNKTANAQGNVRLITQQGEIAGERMTFNFDTMTGDFHGAKIVAQPYYGEGKRVSKVSDNEIDLIDGYMTTCDHDKPHFRLTSRKMEVYPGDKLIARRTKLMLGKVPVMYLPRFTQRLDGKKPLVVVTPGYNKEWGMFALSKWFYHLNDNFKGFFRLDAREKRDIASGFDVFYKTPHTGSGLMRTYYMNERKITSKRFYKERPSPTIERERFKGEWRHKWNIDDQTNAIWQYYKLSDSTLLKEYFENEYEKEASPQTFFLLTRGMPKGVLSLRTDARVNRFESIVERLPEVKYDFSNNPVGGGFYLKNASTFSSLVKKDPSPSEVHLHTMRLDFDNELSYPLKLGFIELKPFVGGEHTYYSRAKDPSDYDSIRGIFRTGSTLSTRFYRVYDTETDWLRLDVHRLRHIVAPSVSYIFQGEPTLASSDLDTFDSIDSADNKHSLNFALENKLQTKREGKPVDLIRGVVSTDFYLKEHPAKGGFNNVNTDIDFRPKDWLTLYFDSVYDTHEDQLSTANFDLYINGKDNQWTFGIGKRYNHEVDDQLTSEFGWKLNPKWALKWYQRFDTEGGVLKEQEYSLRRDLHEWYMDINFNETRGEGDEIWLIFTLKAFPDMAIDVGSSFNKRKAGSQSSIGE